MFIFSLPNVVLPNIQRVNPDVKDQKELKDKRENPLYSVAEMQKREILVQLESKDHQERLVKMVVMEDLEGEDFGAKRCNTVYLILLNHC